MSSNFLDGHGEEHEESERGSDESSSSEDEQDLTWEDWVSDSVSKRPCKSLFDETVLTSVAEIEEWDRSNHGFDLEATVKRLCTSPFFEP